MQYALTGRDATAEAVILSAGLGGAGGFWAPQMATLEASFRVVTYDHRGTGRNAEPLGESTTIAAMAADVVEILDRAGTSRAHFVGHALGGLIGLQLALDAPDRLLSLVLINGWAALDPHTRRCFEARLALLRHAGPEAYVRAQPIFLYPAAWLSANVERAMRDDAHGIATFQGRNNLERRVAALQAFDVNDRIAAITTPALVAAARDDVLVPYTCSEHLARHLPNARLWTVPEGGHGFSVTDPEPFNEALLAFLSAPVGAERNR